MTEDRPHTLVGRLQVLVSLFWRELAKFGVIGAVGFVIDFGGFNLLFYGPLTGHLTTSKIISGAAATLVAWVGNRMWTFRHRRKRPAHHEALLFFAVNGVGLAISTLWLNFTHDGLNLTSRGAVNLNTIIGIGFATIFRFWAYRQVVFAGEHPGDPEPEDLAEAGLQGADEGADAGTDARAVENDRGPAAP
ncbi:MAG: GtrA family protein [Lapillicoccus sp.]